MDVETQHPEYTPARIDDWCLCSDAFEGESRIKHEGEKYLTKPSAYSSAGGHPDNGRAAYGAYKSRAEFPEIMAVTVGAIAGVIHDKEIQVEIPAALEYLHENADGKGTTLVDFHKRITRRLLVSGRYGVLADAPEGGGDPVLIGYDGPTIINWDADWYVLDETHDARQGYKWETVKQFRELYLDGGYKQRLHTETDVTEVDPRATGGGVIPAIPFAVASARDIGPDIETPPLVGVARAAKAIYQLSADYRLQLFMTGQETAVFFNCDAPSVLGAGTIVSVKGAPDLPVDAQYLSPTGAGITAHKEAMERSEMQAVKSGARMFEVHAPAQESGSARQLRYKSETANMMTVAQASCSLLERSLRNAAMIKGIPFDDITVTPPKDLLSATVTPQEAAALWQVVRDRGLSYETFYSFMQAGGLAHADRTAEEEFALIDARDMAPAMGEPDFDGDAV